MTEESASGFSKYKEAPLLEGSRAVAGCVSKLDNDLSTLLASTFIGGSDFDREYLLSIDDNGNILLSGHMSSTDFPTTAGTLDEDAVTILDERVWE